MDNKKPIYFLEPTQVMYTDLREEDTPRWLSGIAYRQEIICGCCGGVIDIDKLVEAGEREGYKKVIFPYSSWCDISEEITGGEYPPGLGCIDGKTEIVGI